MLLSACATNGAATKTSPISVYCALANPIYISKSDTFTEETAKRILEHNETWAALCKK